WHSFNNTSTKYGNELISLPQHKPLFEKESIAAHLESLREEKKTEFFKVKTEDGVEMDGLMVKPNNFEPTKKYPVVFYVYTEPAGANVKDEYGAAENYLFNGD